MSEFMSMIADNFWVLMLIIVMLCIKGHRISGIILLMIQAVFGFVNWIVIAVVSVSVIIELVKLGYKLDDPFNQPKQQKRRNPDYR